MTKFLVILFGLVAATLAASMAPEASGSPDRSCGGQPILTQAEATAKVAARLRRQSGRGALFTPAGLRILNGKSPLAKQDDDGETAGFDILSYNFDDPPTPDRQLQGRAKTSGFGSTTFWCGYGVGTFSHWFVLPGDYVGYGTWIDIWWNTGYKALASAWCPYWATYCDALMHWTPNETRLAEIHDLSGSGMVGLFTKHCFWN